MTRGEEEESGCDATTAGRGEANGEAEGPAVPEEGGGLGDLPGSDMSKEEIRAQAQAAVLGKLSKEEEEERSRRNKEMLPSEKNLGHMTIDEKYDFARQYKEAGNTFFKEGKYEFALKNYQETITYLRHGLRMGEVDSEGVPFAARANGLDPESKRIISSCHSNMAACALKLERYHEVIKHATSALDMDLKEGAKAKALFRRSKAYHYEGKLEAAYSDICDAKKIDPSDKAVVAQYSAVAKEYRELKRQEHEAAKTLWKGKLQEQPGEDGAAKAVKTESKVGAQAAGDGGGGSRSDSPGGEGGIGSLLSLNFLWKALRGLFGALFGKPTEGDKMPKKSKN